MKNILIVLLTSLFITACSETHLNSISNNQQEIEYKFSICTANEDKAITRGVKDINDLHLIVFDENRRFLSRNKAILDGFSVVNGVNILTFKVTLLSSSKKREIHFIANYSGWHEFPSSHELIGVDEGTIIPKLNSEHTTYWGKFTFDQLNVSSFSEYEFSLLRNQARIHLINKTKNFTIKEFAVYNDPKLGTIAPFEYNALDQSYNFNEGVLTEVKSEKGKPIEWFDYDKIKTIDVFEKNNQTATDKVFIIIKGYTGTFNGNYHYYKVDLVADQLNGTLHNFMRNRIYDVSINSVTTNGYNTPNEAAENPATNNIFGSTELKEYPSVSDGKSLLDVEKLTEIFVKGGEFETQIDYYPDILSSNTKPEALDVELITENYNNLISKWNYNSTTGKLNVTVRDTPSDRVITHSFKVTTKDSENNNLIRYITLYLRRPYNKDFNFTLNNFGQYKQGDNVHIHFNVPKTIPLSVYPIYLNIRTKELFPDSQYKELVLDIINNDYTYLYKIEEQSSGKNLTLHFKRTLSNRSEKIEITSNYTSPIQLQLP